VEPEWVEQERERLGGMAVRERLFRWYPEEFGIRANEAWVALGEPMRHITNAWKIFRDISDILEQDLEQDPLYQ
jgi:hypothetical protein